MHLQNMSPWDLGNAFLSTGVDIALKPNSQAYHAFYVNDIVL